MSDKTKEEKARDRHERYAVRFVAQRHQVGFTIALRGVAPGPTCSARRPCGAPKRRPGRPSSRRAPRKSRAFRSSAARRARNSCPPWAGRAADRPDRPGLSACPLYLLPLLVCNFISATSWCGPRVLAFSPHRADVVATLARCAESDRSSGGQLIRGPRARHPVTGHGPRWVRRRCPQRHPMTRGRRRAPTSGPTWAREHARPRHDGRFRGAAAAPGGRPHRHDERFAGGDQHEPFVAHELSVFARRQRGEPAHSVLVDAWLGEAAGRGPAAVGGGGSGPR